MSPIEKIKTINKAKAAKYFLDSDDEGIIVIGDVDISHLGLDALPVKFSIVTGTFDCSNNFLITLQNCPRIIVENFYCNNNRLTNLEVRPLRVGSRFNCDHNEFNNQALANRLENSVENKEFDWESIHWDIEVTANDKLKSLDDLGI